LHPDYSKIPHHYIRCYLIIQQNLIDLFQFIEPCNQNLNSISIKIHELLVRTCIEIEANFTSILHENSYSTSKNMNMKNDYSLIDYTHKLSSYKVKLPLWTGEKSIRIPFHNWHDKSNENWHSLNWYNIYNKSKHERYSQFHNANFDILLDAVCALVVLLSSQFLDETFSTGGYSLVVDETSSYNYDPNFKSTIGDYFTVKFPNDWSEDDKYDFDWNELKKTDSPIRKIDYNTIKETNGHCT